MDIALLIVEILLGVSFIMFGSMKAFQYEKAKVSMPWMQEYSKSFVVFIGIAEVLGGLGVILPRAIGLAMFLTPIAAIGLGLIMLLAAGFHLKRKENEAIFMNVILLALALFVAIGHL